MLFGADTYTNVHVALSLVGIATGLLVLGGFLADRRLDALTAVFLVTTIATSVTGFGFPFGIILPSHIVGAISLVVLAIAVFARYWARMRRHWRWVYVITATIALYLNVFVLVVQLFLKVESLHELAPTQSEPAFAIAHGITFIVFLVLGFLSVLRFRSA